MDKAHIDAMRARGVLGCAAASPRIFLLAIKTIPATKMRGRTCGVVMIVDGASAGPMCFTPTNSNEAFDPRKDFERSLGDAYRAVRHRMKDGGPEWVPKPCTCGANAAPNLDHPVWCPWSKGYAEWVQHHPEDAR